MVFRIDGCFVGAAVRRKRGVRFIATDWRVAEMDQSTWHTVDAAARMVRTGQVANVMRRRQLKNRAGRNSASSGRGCPRTSSSATSWPR